MQTLVLQQPRQFVLTDTPIPRDPGPGEALVRVHRVGVCGTDLHAFSGRQPFFSYPRILGHELGVEVKAIGPGVANVRAGDRCAVEPYLNCGHCRACRVGKPNCCSELRVLGVHSDGGLREWIVVPAAKLHPSARLSFDQLALVETLGIGAHAVQRAALKRGETVAVVGAGPIGASVVEFAREKGCRVIVADRAASRLAFCRDAQGIPAADLVEAAKVDVSAELARLTGGDRPAAVFDATGNDASMASAFTFPAHGGRLVLVGLFNGVIQFNDPDFHRRELTLLASRNSLPEDFRRIIGLMESGRLNVSRWITDRAALAEAAGQFDRWSRPDSGTLKAMISVAD
jgi:2-desacetyl-2-hydroxyethyl bacteriochlorophyllide A dehydrogenase